MNVQAAVLPGADRLRVAPPLSREARRRLGWIDYYVQHGRNASQTIRHFDIGRETFYRWWRRYDPRRLQNLEDDRQTRRPKRVRQPQTPPELERRIRALREQYPRWGDRKLAVLLRREGRTVSHATIGRVLAGLRAKGQLVEPPVVRAALYKRRRRRRLHRRYATRIALFVLPPRSPRLNGKVERAHRTHQEEFYDLVDVPDDLAAHNTLLRAHEAVYNGVRPHQALGYLTPNEVVARFQRRGKVSRMY